MIVSLAGSAGAALPNPTPETTNTSTPLAVNSVSRVSADPFAVAVCVSATDGRPPTESPGAAFIFMVVLTLLVIGAVNDGQRTASGEIPATNADASAAVENW
jgi:hypothetical protein